MRFGGDLFSCLLLLKDQNLGPGETAVVALAVLYPQLVINRMKVGDRFDLLTGETTVAKCGVIALEVE